jgi:hypothetical protein
VRRWRDSEVLSHLCKNQQTRPMYRILFSGSNFSLLVSQHQNTSVRKRKGWGGRRGCVLLRFGGCPDAVLSGEGGVGIVGEPWTWRDNCIQLTCSQRYLIGLRTSTCVHNTCEGASLTLTCEAHIDSRWAVAVGGAASMYPGDSCHRRSQHKSAACEAGFALRDCLASPTLVFASAAWLAA